MGVPLDSRCNCCRLREREDRDHVLNLGGIAKELWKRALIALGVNFLSSLNWWQRVCLWFRCPKKSSQKGVLSELLPILML